MKHKTSQPFLLHKHSVISCAIAKGGALRERGNVRTSGGSISIVGNGIAYNGGGMKSWGLKDINFRIATMIINSTNLRERTHAPIFYTVCYAPFLLSI